MSILTCSRDIVPVYRWTSLRSVINSNTVHFFSLLDKTQKPRIIEHLLISLRKASKNVSEQIVSTWKPNHNLRIRRGNFLIESWDNNEIIISSWGVDCKILFKSNWDVIFRYSGNSNKFVISAENKYESDWFDTVIFRTWDITFEEIILIANLINFVVWENVDTQSVNLFRNFDKYKHVYPILSDVANLPKFLNFLYRISTTSS